MRYSKGKTIYKAIIRRCISVSPLYKMQHTLTNFKCLVDIYNHSLGNAIFLALPIHQFAKIKVVIQLLLKIFQTQLYEMVMKFVIIFVS